MGARGTRYLDHPRRGRRRRTGPFERAAARQGANVPILDHDLDIAPGLGRRATIAEMADLVDDIAARLWAAEVRPGRRVVVHKSDGFDITLLACAIARIGGVPVLLSPKLDGGTVAELIRRTGRPFLITDQAKVDDELPAAVFDLAEQAVLVSGSHPRPVELDALTGAVRVAPVTLPATDPTLITHTCGTTGVPKLAALAISLYRGFPLVVLRESDPEHVGDLFARLKPGILEAHPNSFMEWERLAEDPRGPLSHVKLCSASRSWGWKTR